MEQLKTESEDQIKNELPPKDRFLGISILIAAAIIGGVWIYTAQLNNTGA